MLIRYVGARGACRPAPHLPVAARGVDVDVDDEVADELVRSDDWEKAKKSTTTTTTRDAGDEPEEGN